jgi:hypothetical protein
MPHPPPADFDTEDEAMAYAHTMASTSRVVVYPVTLED